MHACTAFIACDKAHTTLHRIFAMVRLQPGTPHGDHPKLWGVDTGCLRAGFMSPNMMSPMAAGALFSPMGNSVFSPSPTSPGACSNQAILLFSVSAGPSFGLCGFTKWLCYLSRGVADTVMSMRRLLAHLAWCVAIPVLDPDWHLLPTRWPLSVSHVLVDPSASSQHESQGPSSVGLKHMWGCLAQAILRQAQATAPPAPATLPPAQV